MRRLVAVLIWLGGTAAAAEVFRHGRLELSFTASREYDDPLREVEAAVEFRGPGGETGRTAAFWDGGRGWKARFSPERSGAWSYRVRSSDPALDGRTGSFQASEYKGSNQLYRRGAPRVSPNRRYFVHGDGSAWFWLACTGWNSAILSTDEEWKQYLEDRKGKKFTAIQFVMHAPWRAGRKDELGNVAFSVEGRLRVHPEFFRRMDRKMDQLNDAGLAGAPVLLWALTSKDKESPGAVLSDEDAARLAGYMVARYGAHHVLWLLGGDGNYRGANAERWKRIGRAVFPEGQPRRPVTLHPGGMQDPWPELKDEPWLDFLMYQTGHGSNEKKWAWNATGGTALGWKMEPVRPVLDGEPNYEGHLSYQSQTVIGDAEVRRAVYYSLLAAPPAGVTYGAHGIWWWGRKTEVPLDHPRTGEALPWHECLDYPGARQMKVMRDIFDSVAWWTLAPDRALLAAEAPQPDWLAYPMPAWSAEKRFALIYLPGDPVVELNLSRFGGRVRPTWIDPRTGERKEGTPVQAAPSVTLKPPGAQDWVLLLR